MSLPQTLFASPSGLWHIAGLMNGTTYHPKKRAITRCGREINLDTWTRYSGLDQWMFGKGIGTIAARVEGDKCDRCFS